MLTLRFALLLACLVLAIVAMYREKSLTSTALVLLVISLLVLMEGAR